MKGKTCLITGANGGIGYETARALSKKGAKVIMIARNKERGEAARERIIQESGNEVDLILGDLSLIKEIKHIASKVKSSYSRLDILINNAGGVYRKRVVTAECLEDTFALNFLAPFALTNELLELLKNSAPARIINVSSSAHKAGRINFNNLQHEKKFSRMKAYANTKLALNLFTFEIARRLEGSGVTCNAVNPGFVTTRPSYASRFEILIGRLLSPLGVSPEKGAIPSIYAACDLELESISGMYLDPKCRQVKASKDSYNEELAAKLLKKAEDLTGSILKEETEP